MIPGGLKGQKGLSLLEILVSITLLTTVMMTFAMVFPSGYRLSRKNRMETQAYRAADGILDKLQNIQFFGAGTTKPTIENMQTWDVGIFADEFGNRIEEPFYLPNASDPDPGIYVKILDPTVGGGGTLAKISATVAWQESTSGGVITKKVTVSGYRSRNHL
ncbi:MAG: type II secretion system GspH family protein [Candidatus Eremiobacteraeota bacterium]|nr:type II secretion system GspH family protein [Candidatus Eremiobacteraeota bacterium]